MPSRMLRDKEDTNKKSYRDMVHPLNNDIRTEMTETIFKAYDEYVKAEN